MKSYIITVKDFQESPKGDSMWYHVVGEDGKKHTLKDEFLKDKHSNILSIKPLVQPGYTCELIKEQHGTYDFKGKEYPNMEVIEVKASTTQQAVKEAVEKDKSSDFATFHLRQTSIERQNALTNAVNSCMRDTVTGVLELAEIFYSWTSKGIIPQIDPNALPSPPQEPTEVSKETAPVKETSKSLFAFGTAEEFKESMQFLCAELKLTKAQATTFLKDNFGVDGLSGITSTKDRCKAIDWCDLLFVYKQRTNPTACGLSAEMGYAYAKGKPIVLVDDNDRIDSFLVGLSQRIYTNLDSAIEYLRGL